MSFHMRLDIGHDTLEIYVDILIMPLRASTQRHTLLCFYILELRLHVPHFAVYAAAARPLIPPHAAGFFYFSRHYLIIINDAFSMPRIIMPLMPEHISA